MFTIAKTSQQQTFYQTNPRPLLNGKSIIVRPIKNTHALYICSEEHWNEKLTNYIQLTNMFINLGPMPSLSSSANKDVQHILNNQTDIIADTLNELHSCQAITSEQYEQMIDFQQLSVLEVNKLDFVLELSYNTEIIIQPTVTCSANEPIKKIVYFINSLLQPLIKHKIHSHSHFATGCEAIQAVENYSQQGYLQSTTCFIKIDISKIFTELPHNVILETLEKFLLRHVLDGHIDGTSITTIIRLTKLILDNQFCVHDNRLYRLNTGGATTSSLIINLFDIFLDTLLIEFSLILKQRKEIIGRSLQQLIFTWNESDEDLIYLIHESIMNNPNHSYSPKTIYVTTGNTIDYFDAQIGHRQGVLYTKVHHHINLEPEALPYVFDVTPTLTSLPRVLLRAAYLRAFLYCSTVIEFEMERMYIDCSFLNNNNSLAFINQTFIDLVAEFDYVIFEDTSIDETTYHVLRERIQQYHQTQRKHIQQQRHRRRRRHQL
ncbi:unnamed protein product, partial [Adineta steineri]